MKTEEATVKFEVGKFYRFRAGVSLGSLRFPALCTKVMKRKVFFQYKVKYANGEVLRVNDYRWIEVSHDGIQIAYVSDRWFRNPFYANEFAEKPKV